MARANAVDDQRDREPDGVIPPLSKNVHRSKNAKRIERWMVTAVIDAGGRFRKIRGYVGMKKLVAALEAHV